MGISNLEKESSVDDGGRVLKKNGNGPNCPVSGGKRVLKYSVS